MNMSQQNAPCTSRDLPGLPTNAKAREVLDIAFYIARNLNPKLPTRELTENLIVDCGQSIINIGVEDKGVAPKIRHSTLFYSFGEDGFLGPGSCLPILGWPKNLDTSCCGKKELQELVGQSHSVPSVAVLLAVMYSNPFGPWWSNA